MANLQEGGIVQLAQAANAVGEIVELTGTATITRATGETVQASVGTEVFQNDTIRTEPGGGIGINFVDESAFSLGSDAQLTIDQLVYNPGGDSGMAMNLVQGAFSFVSGQIAKTGDNNMTIVTPTATIGVRGTAGAGDEDEAVLLQEPGQPLGEMTVTTQGGSVILNSVNAYTSTSNPLIPPSIPVFRPLEQIQSQFGGALRELPRFIPANQNDQGGDDQGATDSEAGDDPEAQAGDAEQPGDDPDGGAPDGEGGEEGGEGEGGEEGEGGDPADGEEGQQDSGLPGDAGDGEQQQAGLTGGETGDPTGGTTGTGLTGGTTEATQDIPNVVDQLVGDSVVDQIVPEAGQVGNAIDTSQAGDGLAGGALDGGTGGATDPTLDPTLPTIEEPPPDIVEVPVDPTADILTDFAQSGTLAVTSGAADIVTLSADLVNVNVTGVTESGDTFTDTATSALSQSVTLQTPGSHSLQLFNVDNLELPAQSVGDVQAIGVGGTQPISISPAAATDLNAVIFGDSVNNNVTLQTGEFSFLNVVLSANLGVGTDTLNVSAITSTVSNVSGIETINGGVSADTVNLQDGTNATIDLGGGTDSVVNFGNAAIAGLTLSNVELFTGGTGNEAVTAITLLTAGNSFDGGGGTDSLQLAGGANTGVIVNFETILGLAGTDTLTLEAPVVGTEIDLKGGSDTLSLADGGGGALVAAQTTNTNEVSVREVETINGGTGDDAVNLLDGTGAIVNLGGGTDTVTNTGGVSIGNLSLDNVEKFFGSAALENLAVGTALTSGSVFDGGGGGDILNLIITGSHFSSITNFASVNGSSGADTLTLEAVNTGTTFNLNIGVDTLILANGANNVLVAEVETVTGGTGNDIVQMTDGAATSIDLGAGNDSVVNISGLGVAALTLTSVETFQGDTDNETVTVADQLLAGAVYDGGGGTTDILNLTANVNTASITDFDIVNGSAVADTLTLEAGILAAHGTEIDLGLANDTLNLFNANNSLLVRNVEVLNGGTGDDTISVGNILAAGTAYDGGAGNNSLNLAGGNNIASLVNFQDITGSAGADQLNLEGVIVGTLINLDAGADSLFLANGANDVSVQGTETITGGNLDDIVRLQDGTNVTVNGGAGNDRVENAGGFAIGAATLSSVETYQGNTNADVLIFLDNMVAGSSYNGGGNGAGGTDIITLSAGANTGSIFDFDQVNGSGVADTVNLEADIVAAFGTEFSLSGGVDTLNLHTGNDTVSVRDVEIVNGNAGNDTISALTVLNAGSVFDGGAGNDILNLTAGANTGTFVNFESINGSIAADTLTFETPVAGTVVDMNGGVDILNIANGGSTLSVFETETVNGGTGNDDVTLKDGTTVTLALGGGTDSVINTSNVDTVITLADVESFGGGSANETVTVNTALLSGSNFNGGGGTIDQLNLTALVNTAAINDFDIIRGTTGDDTLNLETGILAASNTTVDLLEVGATVDTDTLNLFNANNTVSINGVEVVNGGTGDDTVTNTGPEGAKFNLGGGSDTATGVLTFRDDFVYTAATDAALGAGERITNFETGLDKLDLAALSLSTIVFQGAGGFSGPASASFVNGVSNVLQIDINGDLNADLEITLDGVTAANFAQADIITAV